MKQWFLFAYVCSLLYVELYTFAIIEVLTLLFAIIIDVDAGEGDA